MMEGSVPRPPNNGCEESADEPMEKDPAAAKGKNVVVLKGNDVTIRNGIVFMPNTIEMAQLKRPEKGQFKRKVQFSSMMTELDVSRLLVDTFPFLKDQRLYCAAAADNRTRLDFHGQPRIWDGQFLKRKIKGNSALYILTDEGEIEAQIAQNSSSSDTGFCDQEMDISSNGFSESAEPDNSSVPSIAPEHMALFKVVEDIIPKSGSLKGGYEFCIYLTKPSDIRSGAAQFKGVDTVALQKVNPYMFIGTVPSSSRTGDVDVTILDQMGNCLGLTTFRYVDNEQEMVKQLVNNKEMQYKWFSMWAQECTSFGNCVNNYNTAQPGDLVKMQDQGQTKQQQSLQLLQLLVYTAAETGAQEFIKMIFSTSAGRTVFYSYKDKTPLPEDIARANGHRYLAQYLQDVNTRLSNDVGSEAQSNAIDWLELVKAVQTQASAVQVKSVKEEKHPSESDDSSSDYFADSETSSNGSLGLDEANQPDSDSDSSIDKELCNIAGWYNEELNKRPATCAPQEGPSCETPGVEKPLNREDSGAPRLDNKDRTPFEKEKPAAESQEEKDYAVGRGFINSLSQWFSTTRKKRKDETKSATIRRFNVATFFCGPFDEGDTSGQANVHSAENPQECADKDHMSSQRRTTPDLKCSRIVIACVGIAVLAGIMLRECVAKGHLSSQRRTAPDVKYSRIIMACVVMALMGVLLVMLVPPVLPVLKGIVQGIEFTVHHLIAIAYGVTTGLVTEITTGAYVVGCLYYTLYKGLANLFSLLINTMMKKMDESIQPASEGFMEQLGQLNKGDTSGQANVYCAGDPHGRSHVSRLDDWEVLFRQKKDECAEKGHLSSQRRTASDVKYSRIIMACVVLLVLLVLLVLAGIMQGIVFSRAETSTSLPPTNTISSLPSLPPRPLPSSRETQPPPASAAILAVGRPSPESVAEVLLSSQRRTAPDFKCSRIIMAYVLMVGLLVLLVLTGIMQGIECADKDHLSSQRRTAPDFKYSRFIMACVVLVVLLVLTGIMEGIVPSTFSPPKESPPPVPTSLLPSNTISSLLGLPPRALPSSTAAQPSPTSRVTPAVESPVSDRVLFSVDGLTLVVFLALVLVLVFMVGLLFRACIDTGKKKMDGGIEAIERKWPDLSNFIKISLKNPLEHNEWEEKLTTNLEEKLTTNLF